VRLAAERLSWAVRFFEYGRVYDIEIRAGNISLDEIVDQEALGLNGFSSCRALVLHDTPAGVATTRVGRNLKNISSKTVRTILDEG